MLQRESEEARGFVGDLTLHVGNYEASSVLAARKAEAVVTTKASDLVTGGVIDVLKDDGVVAAVMEGRGPARGDGCNFKGGTDADAVGLPRGMAEQDAVETVLFLGTAGWEVVGRLRRVEGVDRGVAGGVWGVVDGLRLGGAVHFGDEMEAPIVDGIPETGLTLPCEREARVGGTFWGVKRSGFSWSDRHRQAREPSTSR